jgi:hypothetical protein
MNDLAVELGNWVSLPTASTPRFSAEARHRRPVLQQHRVGRRTSLQSLPELARWSPLRGAALNVHWSPAFESVLELWVNCRDPAVIREGQLHPSKPTNPPMDEAALMLETSDDAIDRIADRVGYETTTAFSKAFRQHYGISPGRYRSANGSDA